MERKVGWGYIREGKAPAKVPEIHLHREFFTKMENFSKKKKRKLKIRVPGWLCWLSI